MANFRVDRIEGWECSDDTNSLRSVRWVVGFLLYAALALNLLSLVEGNASADLMYPWASTSR